MTFVLFALCNCHGTKLYWFDVACFWQNHYHASSKCLKRLVWIYLTNFSGNWRQANTILLVFLPLAVTFLSPSDFGLLWDFLGLLVFLLCGFVWFFFFLWVRLFICFKERVYIVRLFLSFWYLRHPPWVFKGRIIDFEMIQRISWATWLNVIRSSQLGKKSVSVAISNNRSTLVGYFSPFIYANCASHLLVVDLFSEDLFFINLFSLFIQ